VLDGALLTFLRHGWTLSGVSARENVHQRHSYRFWNLGNLKFRLGDQKSPRLCTMVSDWYLTQNWDSKIQ
jgi:hypothetical protein